MAGRRARTEDTLRIVAGASADPAAGSPRTQDAKPLPNDLPLEITSFVGRERELAEIKETLEGTRLLTITGPGGSGKTRLALRMAADLAERFQDGARWVELAALSDPNLVPQRVASALGVREVPHRCRQRAQGVYRRGERRGYGHRLHVRRPVGRVALPEALDVRPGTVERLRFAHTHDLLLQSRRHAPYRQACLPERPPGAPCEE